MADNSTSYGNIFKTTFVFGFVQVIRMLVSLIKNKLVAILLGPSGMGNIGIYNNAINLIKTGAGLGISKSAVKDVSEANSINDENRFSRVISLTNKLVIYTSIFGALITIVLSPFLSKWGFGDKIHIVAFVFLSIAVAFEVLVENQLAILKGMRQMKALAKASLIGSIVALITGVPLFFIYGEKGIVPSIIISSISAAVVSIYYVSKIKYNKVKISFIETMKEGGPMIKMGFSLMMSNFLSFLFNMTLLGYIQKVGGIEDVGIYSAGATLVVSYFSVITTALNTDYYPRIAAINSNNGEIATELVKQSRAGLLLMFPLVVLFILFSPIIVQLLFSPAFKDVTHYTDIAIIGIIISVVSDCFGYIFIVKSESKLYLTISILFNLVSIPLFIFLYKFCGLYGLGIAFMLNVLAQLMTYSIIAWNKYRIILSKGIVLRLVIIILVAAVAAFVRDIEYRLVKYIMGSILLILSFCYSFIEVKKTLGVSPIEFFCNRIQVSYHKQNNDKK